jgi:hypothetical protein
MAIWYIFTVFGMLNQEKSGNPGAITAAISLYFHEANQAICRIFI